ncbi:caskin-2-like isoform X2 [Sitophilus oryzae]|uniref:Caskin-2-like isoform X2 n=1 Tax=Sitophilus oryzae TaxID=7048 RepID=A0A6J2Y510_SITOR|nr:caskin-2-like isoform X2 [Sitophilus oryzae]
MIHQGVPDQDIIHSWLVDLQFEEYYPLFVSAGYDLPTIGRMTPEDLTAIGIKKPNHRKKLKAEIAQLNLPDNLPEFIPGSLEEWLNLLRLDEYLSAFIEQGYQTIDDVAQLTWEDLEEFGIVKLGHQKKVMLAIKRIKDIKAGKRINSESNRIYSTQIRTGRGKSLESLEDPNERTHHTFSADNTQTFYYQQPVGWRVRSYDDGDLTPTNETALLYEGGGTLPRPRGIIRPRPIAKITAKARETFPDFEKPQFNPEKYSAGPQYKPVPNAYAQYGSPMMGKKIPPNPPKRRDSECGSEETTTVEIHHVQTSSPLPLPAYPSSDSLSISLDSGGDLPLPPPPAPGTPPGKLNSSQSWGAEEQELIKTLALQHRNGSDASFKSSSSTESDSLPFANENAGTIRTRAGTAGRQAEFSSPKPRPGLPPHPSPTPNTSRTPNTSSRNRAEQPVDVLNDIGNMLANLTDELDAMLEEEKRQQ